jgi:hypothetical protein
VLLLVVGNPPDRSNVLTLTAKSGTLGAARFFLFLVSFRQNSYVGLNSQPITSKMGFFWGIVFVAST